MKKEVDPMPQVRPLIEEYCAIAEAHWKVLTKQVAAEVVQVEVQSTITYEPLPVQSSSSKNMNMYPP